MDKLLVQTLNFSGGEVKLDVIIEVRTVLWVQARIYEKSHTCNTTFSS
jgi:hypothetical protein